MMQADDAMDDARCSMIQRILQYLAMVNPEQTGVSKETWLRGLPLSLVPLKM